MKKIKITEAPAVGSATNNIFLVEKKYKNEIYLPK